jgi:WD40 repeat protein
LKRNNIIIFILLLFSLNAKAQQTRLSVQKGHTSDITQLVYSDDGTMIASGDLSGRIVLWDVAASQQMDEIEVGKSITVMKFSEGNSCLFFGCINGAVYKYDIRVASLVELGVFRGLPVCIFPRGDSLCLISAGYLFQWTQGVAESLPLSNEEFIYIGQSSKPDSLILITATGEIYHSPLSTPQTIVLSAMRCQDLSPKYYRKRDHYLRKLKRNSYFFSSRETVNRNFKRFTDKRKIQCIDYCPEKDLVAYGIHYTMHIRHLKEAKKDRSFTCPYFDERFTSCVIDKDHEMVYAACSDYTIYPYNLSNGKRQSLLKDHLAGVNALAVSPGNKYFASASSDRSVIIWDASAATPLKRLYSRAFRVTALNFHQNRFFFTDETGALKTYKADSSAINMRLIYRDKEPLFDLALPDESHIVCSGINKVICTDIRKNGTRKIFRFSSNISISDFLQNIYKLLLGIKRADDFRVGNVECPGSGMVCASGKPGDSTLSFINLYDFNGKKFRKYRKLLFNVYTSPNRIFGTSTDPHPVNYLQKKRGIANDTVFYSAKEDQLIEWTRRDNKLLYKTVKMDERFTGDFLVSGTTIIYPSPSGIHIQNKGIPGSTSYIFSHSGIFDASGNNVFFTRAGNLYKHDIRTGAEDLIRAGVNDVHLIAIWDDKRLITTGSGGSIDIRNITTGEIILSVFPIDAEKVVMITPDKYYFASRNSLDALGYNVTGKFYPFTQFDLKYNRPDIILERLGFADTSLITAYRKAYEKRLKRMNFTPEMLSSDMHMPEVHIENASETVILTTNANLSLRILATDSKYKLDRLSISVNDVPIWGMDGRSLRELNSGLHRTAAEIILSEGENHISVSCMNEKGVESLKKRMIIKFTPTEAVKKTLFLVAICVSEYEDQRYNLKYAVKDGRDMVKMYTGKNLVTDTLFNRNATRENILALKKRLMQSKVDDEVIVFVSGHGLLDKNFDFYFATWGTDFENPSQNGLLYDELESLLDEIPARKKILLLDACHSGEYDKDNSAENNNSDKNLTGQKGVIKTYGYKGLTLDAGAETDKLGLKTALNLCRNFLPTCLQVAEQLLSLPLPEPVLPLNLRNGTTVCSHTASSEGLKK